MKNSPTTHDATDRLSPDRFVIVVGDQWVSSPTNKLTRNPAFRTVVELDEAKELATRHGGAVEPFDQKTHIALTRAYVATQFANLSK